MKEYRIYIIGPDGHFQNFLPLIALDDEAAKIAAAKMVRSQHAELWELDRKVEIILPEGRTI